MYSCWSGEPVYSSCRLWFVQVKFKHWHGLKSVTFSLTDLLLSNKNKSRIFDSCLFNLFELLELLLDCNRKILLWSSLNLYFSGFVCFCFFLNVNLLPRRSGCCAPVWASQRPYVVFAHAVTKQSACGRRSQPHTLMILSGVPTFPRLRNSGVQAPSRLLCLWQGVGKDMFCIETLHYWLVTFALQVLCYPEWWLKLLVSMSRLHHDTTSICLHLHLPANMRTLHLCILTLASLWPECNH